VALVVAVVVSEFGVAAVEAASVFAPFSSPVWPEVFVLSAVSFLL
jgi:hypothetical protein